MGFIRDRIAARHQQSSCQPCDSQPHFVQSPCAPQPLVYNTPYATMGGGCQPSQFQPAQFQPTADRSTMPAMPAVTIVDAASASDSRKTAAPKADGFRPDGLKEKQRSEKYLPSVELPLPSRSRDQARAPKLDVGDCYQFDGSKPSKSSEAGPEVQSDRTRQLERELRIARDEIDNLKKQIEQLRADQRALMIQLQQPGGRAVVQPPVSGTPYIPQPGAQAGHVGPYTPPPVAQPGQPPPLVPRPAAPPLSGGQPWEAPAHPASPPVAKPWEAPSPTARATDVKPPVVTVHQ